MMVKIFGLIPRRPDMSADAFHDHYRHPHGTLGAQSPTIRGYVQSHQFQTPLLGESQHRFEAVAECWFDSASDALGIAQDRNYLENVAPDEPNFVDMPQLRWVVATEEVIISGPNPVGEIPVADRLLQGFHLTRPVTVKLLHLTQDSCDPPECASLGAHRHVRCVPHPQAHPPESPAEFTEIHELWWPTRRDFERGASPSELQRLCEQPASVTLAVTAERFR